jgi:SAM-dependent methyltransferase
LELGCGTGAMTERLAKVGFDMIGVDYSQEMLSIAMEKNPGDILYLMQDMRNFELYGTVAAVVSVCDSMNYITEKEDLVEVFKLVNNYLDPEGIFIFDLKTEHYYRSLGESVIADDREECSFIWDNYYDEAEKINEYQLSLFVRGTDGRYDKYVEEHFQRAYSIEEIRWALEEAGMEWVQAYSAFSKEEPKEDDERIYIIAREKGKKR